METLMHGEHRRFTEQMREQMLREPLLPPLPICVQHACNTELRAALIDRQFSALSTCYIAALMIPSHQPFVKHVYIHTDLGLVRIPLGTDYSDLRWLPPTRESLV
jgi:hypothetical protein